MPDKVCAPWLAEYLHEMSVFPNGKHDAQVDSTAQFPRLVQAVNTDLGHLRVVPKRGRKTETAGAGLRPRQGAAGDRRGLALLGRRGTSEMRTLDPRKMAPICCSMRVVVFYHRGMGEAAVRSDIFPLVDGGLIGGRLWSEVGQRRAILRNLFGVPPM
jgi:hypothetical protein